MRLLDPFGLSAHPAVPPISLPPGQTVVVPGRGELFYRDSGGTGPVLLLLHGWMATSDLNWITTYGPLQAAGYRVLALDHRGHGRGLRAPQPFRLEDCAGDAAALLEALDVRDAVVVGYSMGGPIASLAAYRHPERIAGVVLGATALHWKGLGMSVLWSGMAGLRLLLGLAPDLLWRAMVRAGGAPADSTGSWIAGELSRGSSSHLAEAGRELSRYDARPWISDLPVAAAVIVTTRDAAVPPEKQRALAAALGAREFDIDADHMAATHPSGVFPRALLEAVAHVRSTSRSTRAVAA
ncbi:alpha/beta hydrolase [Paraconexibacter sp. AEG42_29]|uniref:alpha/beta fold hydrolase n=1 Tax=Paraconexibacter sp. AEG42_29 TaxID=2997339 RepID=UPI00339DA2BC